jgi:hypothetical protein
MAAAARSTSAGLDFIALVYPVHEQNHSVAAARQKPTSARGIGCLIISRQFDSRGAMAVVSCNKMLERTPTFVEQRERQQPSNMRATDGVPAHSVTEVSLKD